MMFLQIPYNRVILEDKSTLYLILFSVPKLTITADVIEFVERDEAPASKTKP